MSTQTIRVADHDIDVSKLDKVLYPDDHAGHTDRAGASTATYLHAGLPEFATALAALTGEPHPLAPTTTGQPGQPTGSISPTPHWPDNPNRET